MLALSYAPAEVEPLEVRFAHPVRLLPDTHSQGHGRPCLQRLHLRQGFSCYLAASRLVCFLIYNFIVILLCDINIFCNFAVNQYSYGDAGGC